MEIYIYDTDITLKGVIDEMSSFIWTRRYWSVGEFKLLVPFTPLNIKLLIKNNLIMKRGDNEVAQITYINIKKNVYGLEEIEVQGKFITNWIDKRLVLKQIIANENSQNLLNRLVNENMIQPDNIKRKFPLLELEKNQADLESGIINYVSEPYISALLAAEALAKASKLGFKIVTDVRAVKHIFVVYKGRDLTADQADNPPCVFSQEFDNVYEQEFTNSIENYKTACYVGGEDREGVTRQIIEVGNDNGLERSEVFINANGVVNIS